MYRTSILPVLPAYAVLRLLAALCVGALISPPVRGAELIQCDLLSLEAAVASGGLVAFTCDGEFTLTRTLVIDKDTHFDAQGHQVVIKGGDQVRLILVNSNVTFSAVGINFADGRVVGSSGQAGDTPGAGEVASGGAILNLGGRVTLERCNILRCSVKGGRGGDASVINVHPGNGGGATGGAIASLGGSISLTQCAISDSSASGGDPGVGPERGQAGAAGSSAGGAIFAKAGNVSVDTVSFLNNRALGGMPLAGSAEGGQGPVAPVALGGAVYLDAVTGAVLHATIEGNVASNAADVRGGGIYIGAGASFSILNQTLVRSNSAFGGRGAGGGLYNGGTLVIEESTLSANTASGQAGRVASVGVGGGIHNEGSLTIRAATLDHNSALGGNGIGGATDSPGAPGRGGAISSAGELRMANATLVANRAVHGIKTGPAVEARVEPGLGGGLDVASGSAVIANVTFAFNTLGQGTSPGSLPDSLKRGAAVNVAATGATLLLANSILFDPGEGTEFLGPAISDGGYNLASDASPPFTSATSLKGVDPLLGALADNGGPTFTMTLLVGSPARDIIPPPNAPAQDQRGTSRPQGLAADAGAVEADFIGLPPTIRTPPSDVTVRFGSPFTLSVVASGGTLSYQWSLNGQPLVGATERIYEVGSAALSDAGNYEVRVSNPQGTAVASAVVGVDAKPRILTQPVPFLFVAPGGTTSCEVTADGPSLTYEWFHGAAKIEGATGPKLTIESAGPGDQGSYYVRVINPQGEVVSRTVMLFFDESALLIVEVPQDQRAYPGCSAVFNVVASGIPPFRYQWRHNGEPIADATGPTLVIGGARAADAGSYTVDVSNGYAEIPSSAANLSVVPGAPPPALRIARFGPSAALTFAVEDGRTYRLLSSSDFLTWAEREVVVAQSSGLVQFVVDTRSRERAYYRVTVDCP